MNRPFLLVPILALAACASTKSSTSDAHLADEQLATMKSLEGNWTGTADHDGQPMQVETSFHVTGNGSTVQETMFKGQPHEMVSMYHIDEGHLMHTHYCAMGNQPRMVAGEPTQHGEIAFEFKDATNMKSMDETHMHQMRIWVKDTNHVEEWWQGWENGKPSHEAHFVLTRK